MELLILILILFTIVFTIYLCGHITETLEEIKIVRADLSNFRNEFNNRIDTISIRHYNVINTRLNDISKRLDELAGEDEYFETNPVTLDNETVGRYLGEGAAKGIEELNQRLIDKMSYEQYPELTKRLIDKWTYEGQQRTNKESSEPCEQYEKYTSDPFEQQTIEKVTPAAIDYTAQNNAEAERDCIDECNPENCPVEDCKHKQAFLWSLLS